MKQDILSLAFHLASDVAIGITKMFPPLALFTTTWIRLTDQANMQA
jgi:hypothetical protein